MRIRAHNARARASGFMNSPATTKTLASFSPLSCFCPPFSTLALSRAAVLRTRCRMAGRHCVTFRSSSLKLLLMSRCVRNGGKRLAYAYMRERERECAHTHTHICMEIFMRLRNANDTWHMIYARFQMITMLRARSYVYVRIRFAAHQHKADIVLADSSVTAGAVIIFN